MAELFASPFWTGFLWPLIVMVAQSLLLLVLLLIAIAYILLADRKIWAAVQIRRGPNVVGPWGLLQSFADLLKFVLKEPTIPSGANKGVFLLAPLVSCVLALAAWAVIPTNLGWAIADINVGILYIFAISSLSIYGIIMAGWSSNSKYPFLAALRSAAQMVSSDPVPRRLAPSGRPSAIQLGPGHHLVLAETVFHVLHVCDGEGDRAALPLRSADAAGLESVPADIAGDGDHRRRRAAFR